jgi:hypothetical protein
MHGKKLVAKVADIPEQAEKNMSRDEKRAKKAD